MPSLTGTAPCAATLERLADGFVCATANGIAPDNSYNAKQDSLLRSSTRRSKVRGKAEIVSIYEKGGGWWELATRFTLEVEGTEKPCFVGDSVTRVMAPAA